MSDYAKAPSYAKGDSAALQSILPAKGRLPSLDGWRAISIVLVLLSHATFSTNFPETLRAVVRWFPDGGFGVEVFFVISGFLITHLMLSELRKTGRMSVGRFYARRALRIIPAYAVFLCAIFSLTALTTFDLQGHQWLRLLTWTSNYGGNIPFPVGHIWSLSVEEQFYLLWPAAFVAVTLTRSDPFKALVIVCLVPICFAPCARVLSYVRVGAEAFGNWSFLTRADSLAWGCLLALVCNKRSDAIASLVERHTHLIALLSVSLIAAPLILVRLFLLGPLTVPLSTSMNAMGICGLLVLSLRYPTKSLFRILNFPPVRLLGAWSYSIYLWQQLFCTNPAVFGMTTAPWLMQFPYWFAPAIGMGIASYYLVEIPFLKLKDRYAAPPQTNSKALKKSPVDTVNSVDGDG